MEYARNYYSVLASISGVILGVLGVVLGYFYYENRKNVDISEQRREQQCRRLEAFMSKLDKYDEYVHQILACAVKNDKELNFIRTKILICFENIQSILEEGYGLLGITRDDTKSIIRVNSFVEKNDLITRYPLARLCVEDVYLTREKYIERMREARLKCYKSII